MDLLAYQHLVIQAHQEYQGDCWLGYNCRFRQAVSTREQLPIHPGAGQPLNPRFGAWPFQAEPAQQFVATASVHPTLQEIVN